VVRAVLFDVVAVVGVVAAATVSSANKCGCLDDRFAIEP
jgi:hypothetical protein